MEIVIKVSVDELAQSGMNERDFLTSARDHLAGINSALTGVRVTLSVSMGGAPRVSNEKESAPRGAMQVPGFILTQWDDFNQKPRYFHSVVELPEFGSATVCPYTLVFDLPEGLDAKTAALEGIRTRQAALAADFAAKQQALNLQLQEITGKPAD